MAEEIRRATGTRPAARRRAPAGRRPAPRRAGWLVPLLAVTAGGLVAGSSLAPTLVEVTASTGFVPAPFAAGLTGSPSRPSAQAPAPQDTAAPLASVAGEGGLAVPQPPRPGRITIVPNAAIGTPPTYSPRPDACAGFTSPRRIVPGVVAGAGSATLEWMADGRPEVLGYRVQAVSQQLVGGAQPPPVVQSVAQPGGCVPVTVRVTGLNAGTPYVFWLEEQVTSASTGVTRLVQVGTSDAVVIR
jgi:hypothetical protein